MDNHDIGMETKKVVQITDFDPLISQILRKSRDIVYLTPVSTVKIRMKHCVELTKYYELTEEELEEIYRFLEQNPVVKDGIQSDSPLHTILRIRRKRRLLFQQ